MTIRKRKLVLLGWLLLCTMSTLVAQDHLLKVYGGKSYYLGDLSPTATNASFSPGGFAWGIGYSYRYNDWFNFGSDFIYGSLEGSDRQSVDDGRRMRNLSFYSHLVEINVHTEFSLTQLVLDTSLYGIDVYYKTGLGLMNVNPKTMFNGMEYTLRDYATEGQGIMLGKEKYSNTQLVIPLGLSLGFDVSEKVRIGIEAVTRLTFTDYIDDVSGTYPDFELLSAALGEEAVMLSYRKENLSLDELSSISGTQRGDANDNDWYSFIGVSLQYTIQSNRKPKEPMPAIQSPAQM